MNWTRGHACCCILYERRNMLESVPVRNHRQPDQCQKLTARKISRQRGGERRTRIPFFFFSSINFTSMKKLLIFTHWYMRKHDFLSWIFSNKNRIKSKQRIYLTKADISFRKLFLFVDKVLSLGNNATLLAWRVIHEKLLFFAETIMVRFVVTLTWNSAFLF